MTPAGRDRHDRLASALAACGDAELAARVRAAGQNVGIGGATAVVTVAGTRCS